MSAWFKPACGQAPATLSTLTPSAGRVAAAAVAGGRPVSGSTPEGVETDGEALVACELETGVDDDEVSGVGDFGVLDFALVHEAVARRTTATSIAPDARLDQVDRRVPVRS